MAAEREMMQRKAALMGGPVGNQLGVPYQESTTVAENIDRKIAIYRPHVAGQAQGSPAALPRSDYGRGLEMPMMLDDKALQELRDLRARWIDLACGIEAVHGKEDPAAKALRLCVGGLQQTMERRGL